MDRDCYQNLGNISVRFSFSLLNMSLTMSLLSLYLTEHPAGFDDLFLLKQQSGYEHHQALSEPVFN